MSYPQLTRIRIAGFRSLRDLTLELRPVTVLIGPNGSGKSNLLSALRMIAMMRTGALRVFVGDQGAASTLLHYGPSKTRELEVELDFATAEDKQNGYKARLGYAAGDSFIFLDEQCWYEKKGSAKRVDAPLGAGHAESRLGQEEPEGNKAQKDAIRTVAGLVSNIGFFHFHDTSPTSPLRQSARVSENRYLRWDGSNLASFLYRLRNSEAETRASWNLISGLVRRIAPFIQELDPALVDPDKPNSLVRLYWIDENGHRFDTHDLSDGTLRAIALITALAQPSKTLPKFIAIDEPELGLHPAAVNLLASLVESISVRSQVLLATQSPALLDLFDPSDVAVVEREAGSSSIRYLDTQALESWLEQYSLSELYDKNVLGGRP